MHHFRGNRPYVCTMHVDFKVYAYTCDQSRGMQQINL